MTLQTWLADELRAAGLTVAEVAGWQTRQTRIGFDPEGVVCHDTVTPPGLTRDQEQAILVKGRPDLAGPLAQMGLHRDGVVSLIAAGRCSHNGGDANDQWPDPIWGNDSYGLEVFCYGGEPGHVEPYNHIQLDVVAEVSAVLCHHHGWDESRVQGHKETDPHRKVDPFGVSMAAVRLDVRSLLHPAPPGPIPDPHPPTTEESELIVVTCNEKSPAGIESGSFFYPPLARVDGGSVKEALDRGWDQLIVPGDTLDNLAKGSV